MVLTTAVLSGCNNSTKKSVDLDSGITLQATDAGNRFELRKAGQKIGYIQTGPDHIFIFVGERENLPQGSLRIPLGESSDEFPDAGLSIRSSNKPGWTEYHRVTSNSAAAKTYPSSELKGSAYHIFETGETEPVTIGGK